MTDNGGCVQVALDAVAANVEAIRASLDGPCALGAVVKADAYGLGAGPIARQLARSGVEWLMVYSPGEAAELAALKLPGRVLVLMPVTALGRSVLVRRLAEEGRLHLTVHSESQLRALRRAARRLGRPLPVHVKIDTGMTRLGMDEQEADRILPAVAEAPELQLAGVFTHPSSADDDPAYTEQQFKRFSAVCARHAPFIADDVVRHFANTPAMLRDRRYHLDMVRIGLSLYGYGMSDMVGEPMRSDPPALRPAVRWTSHIVHVREVPAGTAVGYNAQFATTRPSRLGVVPVGYKHGYPLLCSDRAIMRVGPSLDEAPVRGAVSMDQTTVDLTDAHDAGIGSPVEIISDDPTAPNALPRLAALARSHCYELLCRLSPHLSRRYGGSV